jgi:hypothetical protein
VIRVNAGASLTLSPATRFIIVGETSSATTMERFLKWLDDCDDLMVVFRVQAPALLVTATLALAFLAGLGVFLLLGAPDLHAAP